jgi:hypothetical protein
LFVDSSIIFLDVVDIPFGIENTQAHDFVGPANLNILQRPQVIINYENGHFNEDASLYDQTTLPVIHTGNLNIFFSIVSNEFI